MPKPDYTKMNPTLAFSADNDGAELHHLGLMLEFYDKDGDSVPFVVPTEDETLSIIKKLIEVIGTGDDRRVYFMAEQFESVMNALIESTMQVAHMRAHDPEVLKTHGYDEEIACKGIKNYLNPDLAIMKGEVTAANSDEYLLKNFFHNGQKPN